MSSHRVEWVFFGKSVVFFAPSGILAGMPDLTHILSAINQGDPHAPAELLPLVYDELRNLAALKLAQEKPGQTLQPTALVHEAYLRLIGGQRDGSIPAGPGEHRGVSAAPLQETSFVNRRHFFAAAAEAMRRILVDQARHKHSLKQGGLLQKNDIESLEIALPESLDPAELLAIHEALDQLAAKSARKAELVKLRYFLGCTLPEAADVLGIAVGTAEDDWTYAKAWLRRFLDK